MQQTGAVERLFFFNCVLTHQLDRSIYVVGCSQRTTTHLICCRNLFY